MNNSYKIAILPGDGIGPEIMKEAIKVLKVICKKFNMHIIINEFDIGGIAIDKFGNPLPKSSLLGCEDSNAILLGSIGGPKWDNLPYKERPERGALLKLRQHFKLFINLRPVIFYKNLKNLSPLKDDIIENGFNILCVRELLSGLYCNTLQGRDGNGAYERSFDTAIYYRFEIERITRVAFKLASNRRKKITSIDKSNVLQTSIMWREVVNKISKSYPNVQINHMYIDNAVMQLIKNPSAFDVILCPNLFGDIISDECAIISGSIGMLPSASLNENHFGLYEPAGGSAPDIANQNIANPIAQIRSLALLLKYSFHANEAADNIENAIKKALKLGYYTKDLTKNHKNAISTEEMGNIIANIIAGKYNEYK